jgi:nucleolar GTP-binding protein
MDSPGLLARSESERNEMEELTLAAMKHLPTAVMFVMDLSGQAGDKCSSVADQLQLRREVRERFPRRPWIDVVSKVDLGTVDGALQELEEILDGTPYIKLSIHEGQGIDELRAQVLRMLGEVRVVLDAMGAVDERSARSD